MASALGAAVGTLGTVLFYGTATINLLWQHIGWKAVEEGKLKKLYIVDMGLPWISHLICSFIPTLIITKMGSSIAILLKQVIDKSTDMLTFLFGFILAAFMGINLIGAALVGGFFAVINFKIKMLQTARVSVASGSIDDDDEEEI